MLHSDLHTAFVAQLTKTIPKKSQLTNLVMDVLDIEKESAYRRISGKVFFSVNEMGKIARRLDISIDRLLEEKSYSAKLPLMLLSPIENRSIDCLCDLIDQAIERFTPDPREELHYGNIFNSLPIEFFIRYPLLTKFMYFKWGYYFVGSERFHYLSGWETPDRLSGVEARLEELLSTVVHSVYIWDSMVMTTLVAEIEYLYAIHAIDTEQKRTIKEELASLLDNLEHSLVGGSTPALNVGDADFYVSSIHVGMTGIYLYGERNHNYMVRTNYAATPVGSDSDTFKAVKEWTDSFCNISTLITRTGRTGRRLFFQQQHKILSEL